jgi:3-keto-L-gulonate-6-phosphate decarboxylase
MMNVGYYKRKADFKTVSTIGNNTIKGAIEKASKQGAEVAVIYQRTKKMDRVYVEKQLDLFRLKSPKKAREKIKEVIVVGLSGNVHRHKM